MSWGPLGQEMSRQIELEVECPRCNLGHSIPQPTSQRVPRLILTSCVFFLSCLGDRSNYMNLPRQRTGFVRRATLGEVQQAPTPQGLIIGLMSTKNHDRRPPLVG